MDRVYRLRFDPSADLLQAARDFEGLPDWVEYAEPDRRVEIQEKGAWRSRRRARGEVMRVTQMEPA